MRVRVTYPAVDIRVFGNNGLCIKGYSSDERILEGHYHGTTLVQGAAIVEDDEGIVHIVNHNITEFLP